MGQQSRNNRKDKGVPQMRKNAFGGSKDNAGPPLRGNQVKKAMDDFVNSLSDEHRMLVVLKSQLYDGTWEPMLDDLRHRLADKPYIFKLVNRIEDDIKRIEQMQKFEIDHNIDLADYVNTL